MLSKTRLNTNSIAPFIPSQLAGAYYGASGIPSEWRGNLSLGGLIDSMAEELVDMSNRIEPCARTLLPTVPSGHPLPAAGGGAHASTTHRDNVTHFRVKPPASCEEPPDSKELGVNKGEISGLGELAGVGRAGSVYWQGGLAKHYQVLEGGYM